MVESQAFWAKLFWSIADGKPTEYNELKRTEVFEFFRLLKIHEEKQIKTQKKINEYGKRNN